APAPRGSPWSRSPLRLDASGADKAREVAQRPVERNRLGAGLPVHRVDSQYSGLPVEGRIDPPDQPVAPEDRQHVVAVLPLRLRDIHLEPVEELEERVRAVAVVDEAIERRQERRPQGHALVARVGMGAPFALLEADAERLPTLLFEDASG